MRARLSFLFPGLVLLALGLAAHPVLVGLIAGRDPTSVFMATAGLDDRVAAMGLVLLLALRLVLFFAVPLMAAAVLASAWSGLHGRTPDLHGEGAPGAP